MARLSGSSYCGLTGVFCALFGILLQVFPEQRAQAEPEVTGDTAVQWYDMRSPSGQTLLTRRRLTTTLGVSGYDLLRDDSQDRVATGAAARRLGPMLTFRSRLRYDADYGASASEANPQDPARYVPGFERGPVDLMYAYVEGRRLPVDQLSFRLGRQIQMDALGYWQMDGLALRLDLVKYLAVEGYGGLEVRGGFPMSNGRAERDGVWRGARDGMDPSAFTSFVDRGLAPAYGAALESSGIDFMHARVAYRHVDSTGTVTTNAFTGESTSGTRLSQERLAFALDFTSPDVGGLKTGLVHDLLTGRVANSFVSLDAYASKKVTLSADWDFYQPTFDGDSIFNFFAVSPMHHGELRSNIQLSDRCPSPAALRRAPTTRLRRAQATCFSAATLARATCFPVVVSAPARTWPAAGVAIAPAGMSLPRRSSKLVIS